MKSEILAILLVRLVKAYLQLAHFADEPALLLALDALRAWQDEPGFLPVRSDADSYARESYYVAKAVLRARLKQNGFEREAPVSVRC